MSAITIDELKSRPASQWFDPGEKSELIVTLEGKPVAVMLPVNGGTAESTLAAIRSLRAIQAQSGLLDEAAKNGASDLSTAEIDAEIAASRIARRKK